MLTREQILARRAGVDFFKLPDGSGEVSIKGITHAQAAEVGKAREAGEVSEATALILQYGLVDPALSPEDIRAWMEEDDGGTVEQIAQAIGRLSNLFEGAPKSGVQRARRR
jgi:hypothetical protein